MLGDWQDMVGRVKATLPQNWFVNATPVLDALLAGAATAWSWCYMQLASVKAQARLSTAFGVGLDLLANDFFGQAVVRSGESDGAFRARIGKELLRPKATRAALAAVLTDLTGRGPVIFEPTRPADTGAYSSDQGTPLGLAYSEAGGWGSLRMPFQTLLVSFRPSESGIPQVGGWGCNAGGYGAGRLEYASLEMSQGQVSDSEIFSAVASVLPIATTAWVRIED